MRLEVEGPATGIAPAEPQGSEHLRCGRMTGTCMWPGLREGDWVFYAPLPDGPVHDLIGRVAVARAPSGPVAHRIRRVFGGWLVLCGDLSLRPDSPRRREDVLGVAKAVYRPGHGFVDVPARLPVGPLGSAVLGKLARFFTWAQRSATMSR
ncbi:MAG: S24/S26 family peptidase [Myxococcales bacterium]